MLYFHNKSPEVLCTNCNPEPPVTSLLLLHILLQKSGADRFCAPFAVEFLLKRNKPVPYFFPLPRGNFPIMRVKKDLLAAIVDTRPLGLSTLSALLLS